MKLLIIRHGESETDILDVHEGMSDFELTERGHRQAESVSEYGSQHYSIAKIYHSLLNGRLRRPVARFLRMFTSWHDLAPAMAPLDIVNPQTANRMSYGFFIYRFDF